VGSEADAGGGRFCEGDAEGSMGVVSWVGWGGGEGGREGETHRR